MRLAINHLVDVGHRRIAHVDDSTGPVSSSRRRGYRAAMRRHGLEQEIQTVRGGISQEDGSSAARDLLTAAILPTASSPTTTTSQPASSNPSVAPGIGPGSLARLPHVNLTTVRQDAEEMTRLAVERSVARIHDDPVTDREQVLSPSLVIRGSTAATERVGFQKAAECVTCGDGRSSHRE